MHPHITPPRTCERCGAPVYAKPNRIRAGGGRFCSLACYSAHCVRLPADRLWAKVDQTGECWLWTGAHSPRGYGNFNNRGVTVFVHRLAWTLTAGAIPPGWQVLHTCDVRLCVRNDPPGTYEVNGHTRLRWGHLFLGTAADNSADMLAKDRVSRAHSRWHKDPTTTQGEHNPRAKLTDSAVRAMRQLRTTGLPYPEIGRRYDVSGSCAWHAVNVGWRHLA